MSTFFKALGVLLILIGVLDLGLQGLGISLWRIIGIEPWWLIGRYTFAFEIIYGLLTIFLANYLKKPRERPVTVVDLADPYIGADSYYVTRPAPAPSLKFELFGVAKAVLWGGLIAAGFLLVFVKFVPGMEAVLFPSAAPPLDPQIYRALVAGAVLAVFLPMIFGFFALRIRNGLNITAMLAGWAVTSILLIVAMLETPRLGNAIYGRAFMEKVYQEMGHTNGLPAEWSAERELMARLQRVGRLR